MKKTKNILCYRSPPGFIGDRKEPNFIAGGKALDELKQKQEQ